MTIRVWQLVAALAVRMLMAIGTSPLVVLGAAGRARLVQAGSTTTTTIAISVARGWAVVAPHNFSTFYEVFNPRFLFFT